MKIMLVHVQGEQGPEKGACSQPRRQASAKGRISFPVQQARYRIIQVEIKIAGNKDQVAELDRDRPADRQGMVLKDRYPE